MKMFLKTSVVVVCTALLLSACGTTSGLKSADAGSSAAAKPVALQGYDKVVVLNFTDNAESAPHKGGETFAATIAKKVADSKAFSSVARSKSAGKAIVVSGKVREYKEGDAVLRGLIGFGAGSSYFDADVNFTDNQTGKPMGEITVDKNSWVLGGLAAATQDVKSHMDSAAETIAEELKKAKQP
jgi:hypothetical protein